MIRTIFKVVQEKKRETVQVITKDLIRNVIVPSKDPSGQSIVLRRHNLNRIKSNSKVKSQSEIEAEAARRQAEKEELAAEVIDRKHHFAVLDMDKKANEGLNDLEHEAKKENEYLLEKARIAKIEQEDRIKKLNELIVDAKVLYFIIFKLFVTDLTNRYTQSAICKLKRKTKSSKTYKRRTSDSTSLWRFIASAASRLPSASSRKSLSSGARGHARS